MGVIWSMKVPDFKCDDRRFSRMETSLYTSRFRTSSACVWMKLRRGATTFPMSTEKMLSAWSMSAMSTCRRVLRSGSIVVSQSWFAFIWNSRLKPFFKVYHNVVYVFSMAC